MGTFLQRYPWSHFHTLTFRQISSEEYARREWARWLRRVGEEARVPLFWFYGIEHGEHFGRLHLHALTGNTERLPREVLRDEWRAGFSRILEYDTRRGAAHYVAKYVTKELSEWDISPLPDAAATVARFRAGSLGDVRRLGARERTRARVRASLTQHGPALAQEFLAPEFPLISSGAAAATADTLPPNVS